LPFDIDEISFGRQRAGLIQHRAGRIEADGTPHTRGKCGNNGAWAASDVKRLVARLRPRGIH